MKLARLLLALCAVCLLVTSNARATPVLDVGDGLRGVDLQQHVALLVDPSNRLTRAEVASPALQGKFGSDPRKSGFVDATHWLRLVVRNTAKVKRAWLLEVAYPHLDHVTLYVAEGAGYVARETGDMHPFKQRDFAYRNFVFMLEEKPQSERVYYLRVKTSSAMTVPLMAWSMKEFIEHQHVDWAFLCMFYGALLVMTCYNLCLYVLTKQRAHLYFGLAVLSFGFLQATLVGHTFQFLLPDSMVIVQRLLPFTITTAFLFSAYFGGHCLPPEELPAPYKRLIAWEVRVAYLSMFVSLVAPYRWSMGLAILACVGFGPVAFAICARLLWTLPGARLMMAAFLSLIGGMVVMCAKTLGILPTHVLTTWSVQIGAALQFVLASAHLADRLNVLRANVDAKNNELSTKVGSLEDALARATEATERAEQAARVKDEFMATMSHELRTPLNAIINLPQGLLNDFPLLRYARCESCQATFQLEPDEQLSDQTPCPDCPPGRHLVAKDVVRYLGTPDRTLRYLEKIERSGLHLLQVVNGILDAEQVKSGQLALTFGEADVGELVREVVEEMSDLAERGGVRLVVKSAPDGARLIVDRLRLRQVLINLISNAIKFSDGRGTVSVSAEAASDGFRFAVKDEGIGIAQDKLEAVFGSFEQVHRPDQRKFGGSGLGLFISRSLVRKHGGEMWVDSKLGEGATFRFHIPRRERARSTAGINLRESQTLMPALAAQRITGARASVPE